MEFNLSSLVDMALGKPHNLECENFDLLHTLLHIILNKLNLSDTRVELTDGLAKKAKNLLKLMPMEPSICLKEFTIKDDGSKVKKRNPREVGIKRSLTQVKRKWPKCCPTPNTPSTPSSSLQSLSCSIPDGGKFQTGIAVEAAKRTSNIETRMTDWSRRIENLENEFCGLSMQVDVNNAETRASLEELLKLNRELDKASAALEKLRYRTHPLDLDSLMNKISSKNCEVKINLRKKSASSEGTTSGDTTVTSTSDDDEELQEEESAAMNDIKWLKGRMFELSEALNLQSECLRKIKCGLKDDSEKMMDPGKSAVKETLNSVDVQDFESVQAEVTRLKTEMCNVQFQLQDIEKKIEAAKEAACEQLNSLRLDLLDKIDDKMLSCSSKSHISRIINTTNLEKSDDGSSLKANQNSDGKVLKDLQSVLEQNFGSINESFAEVQKFSNNPNRYQSSEKCCPIPSKCASFQYPMCQPVSCDSTRVNLEAPGYPVTPEYAQSECSCFGCQPDRSHSNTNDDFLSNIQKQVSSHSLCLQQLIRDMGTKLDLAEFDKCRRHLNETIDLVMKIKDRAFPPTAAGVSIPLLRNVNCISCQTTTNMTVIAGPAVPRAPALKYGRVGSEAVNCSMRSHNQSISSRNWDCYTRNGARRNGGSHTKISKAMQIREMRFKRLKTPVKRVSSIFIYRNRYRRRQHDNC